MRSLKRSRLWAAATAALVLLVTIFVPSFASSASAATALGVITTVTVDQESVTGTTAFRVDLDWRIPDDAVPGDVFHLQLPPELYGVNNAFTLMSPAGDIIATVVGDSNGYYTFTLTAYVATHDDVAGHAYFWAAFRDVPRESGPVPLAFDSDGQVFEDTITYIAREAGGDHRADKVGFWRYGDQGVRVPVDALGWRVTSPMGPVASVKFEDTVDAGHKISCDSLLVRSTTTYLPSGFYDPATLVPVDPSRYDVECDGDGYSVTMPAGVLAQEIVEVYYRSTVTDVTMAQYVNSATVTTPDQASTVNAVVTRTDAGGEGSGNGLGQVLLRKVVDLGEGASAPTEFELNLTCTLDGAALAGLESRPVRVTAGSDLAMSVPYGAICSVTEPDAAGADSVDIFPASVNVARNTASKTLTVVNHYAAPPVGAFTVTKTLDGIDATQLSEGTSFEIRYTVDGTAAAPLRVAAGETVTSPTFPVGSEVTISEAAPDDASLPEGWTWADATFSVNGEEQTVFTIERETTTVSVTNHATRTEVPVDPDDPSVTPEVPSADAPTGSTTDAPSSLAMTGASSLLPAALGALLLVSGLLVFRRRRLREHS
ncbi:DUF5979 domain-containing protein [Microbacterium sp. NPDC090218]